MTQIISMQLIKMFLMMMVGFVVRKTNVVDTEGNRALSNLLLIVIMPCVILNAFMTECTPELLRGVAVSALLAICIHIIFILLSNLLIKKDGNPLYCEERFACIYSNSAFIGIPLISSILGSEGVLYLTSYVVVLNLLVWTHGLILMTGKADMGQLKKGLTTPTCLSIYIGLIVFVFHIQLPEPLADSVTYLANVNTPMAMLISGIALADADLASALKRPRLYYVCAIKLLIMPAIGLLFFFLPVEKNVLYTLLIAAACPTAAAANMFALRYDKNYRYTAELFIATTVLSMVTIPLVIMTAEKLFG